MEVMVELGFGTLDSMGLMTTLSVTFAGIESKVGGQIVAPLKVELVD